MRVLLLNKAYPPVIGGIERHVETLASGLARRGTEVEVLVCNEGLRRVVEGENHLTVIRLPSPGKVASMHLGPTTPLWVRRLRVDLIHVHLPYPMGDLSAWLTRPSAPIVATWHSDIVRQRHLVRFYRPLREWFLGRADRILVTSPPLLENTPALSAYRTKCRVVPLGIEPERFLLTSEVERRAREIRDSLGTPLILFVGRLVKYKGLHYLLRAMPPLQARLLIVGNGPLRKALEAECHALSIAERVLFAGTVSDLDLAAYYHACDLLALPSIGNNEAFGLVQLEAMVCGKPVVSTKLSTGVPYVNVDGETGLVVPPEDPDALGRAIAGLLGDPLRRAEMGRRGRERVEQLFTAERMVDEVLRHYREVSAGSAVDAKRLESAGSGAG